jgi:hypothetical protein
MSRSGNAGDTDDEGGAVGERDHLSDAPDGCGCTEVWEHLSERRAEE